MKEKAFLFLFIISILFCSCAGKRNSFGCYTTLEDASKNAERKGQEIIVLITKTDDSVSMSNFLQYFYPNFTIVQISGTESENPFLSKMNIKTLPKVSLFSKEGYFIFDFEVGDTLVNEEIMNQYVKKNEEINQFKSLVRRTQKGTDLQKVQAIYELFQKIPTEYRFCLKKLIKNVPSYDKKNESNLVKTFLIEETNFCVQDYLLQKEMTKAAKTYAKLAESKYLTSKEKQLYYYCAAVILLYTNQQNKSLIKKYLQKAIKADKDSEDAIKIQNMLDLQNS